MSSKSQANERKPLANQRKYLANQRKYLANQRKYLANQRNSVANLYQIWSKQVDQSYFFTGLGGEITCCSELCDALVDESFNLQDTVCYTSWLNGKAERHTQTA